MPGSGLAPEVLLRFLFCGLLWGWGRLGHRLGGTGRIPMEDGHIREWPIAWNVLRVIRRTSRRGLLCSRLNAEGGSGPPNAHCQFRIAEQANMFNRRRKNFDCVRVGPLHNIRMDTGAQ